ncbi:MULTISPECIES: hypothetical protein [unclassified Rhizobium]|uniref:hypothetical protein n=1 Tax=unclassified Rhizobium TaxID=2613769 RepID=UPI0006F6E608|nr:MULTISPECIES: hypothetical protein [unclassified Rhizobium]KQV42556.1 hypothetical protein ASC86_19700 [Rhizobium sp. Root1212]KRD21414.1 hypothetical protein ASE37_17895 [Rhizobium sp. Root268]
MLPRRLAISVLFALSPSLVLADPVGSYDVTGVNPDSGDEYSGTVAVTRNGTTYSVTWTIAGVASYGVGLGGKRSGGSSTRPAAADDDTLSIGYGNDDGFGISQYDLQPDGSWKGNWAYAGGGISTEVWTPKGRTRSLPTSPKNRTSEAMKPIGNVIARP